MSDKPLIESWVMPGFEKPIDAETQAKEEDYKDKKNSATSEKTADMKAWVMESLYWVKKTNDKIEKKPESDSPYFPVLKNLLDSGHIDDKIFSETTEKLNSSKNDEWLEVLMKVVNNLSDSSVKENIVKSFDKKEKTTEDNFDKTEFSKDCKWLNIDLDKWVGGLELMLADNYISVKNSDWTEDKQRDLSSTMDTTMNSIVKNASLDFKKQNWPLIKEIKSEKSLNKKYDLLKELYKEELKNDAILGWKKSKEEVNIKKNSLMEKAKDITKQRKEAESISDEAKRKEIMEKLDAEKTKIIEEWKDIDWFEAEVDSLSWGKNDKISSEKEKWEKN